MYEYGKVHISSTHPFTDTHEDEHLPLFSSIFLSILFLLPPGRLGSTALHISNYTAALSTTVTHRLTRVTSSLIAVTRCSAGASIISLIRQ